MSAIRDRYGSTHKEKATRSSFALAIVSNTITSYTRDQQIWLGRLCRAILRP
jgi:hypothetical protein